MIAVATKDDVLDDRDAIVAELERQAARRGEAAARAPRGFDPACLFLLDLLPDNLFENVSATPGTFGPFRCKGCGALVAGPQRDRHHAQHKRTWQKKGG